MGYRNEFQTENYGPLTKQAHRQKVLAYGVCSFSHVERISMLKFAHIINIVWKPTKSHRRIKQEITEPSSMYPWHDA